MRQADLHNSSFHIGSRIIENVPEFKYLGHFLTEAYLDDRAIETNLRKAKATWSRIHPILRSDGVSPRVMGHFYKTIIIAVLLYGSESWVVS